MDLRLLLPHRLNLLILEVLASPRNKKSRSQTITGFSCRYFHAHPGPAEAGFVISLIGPRLQFILAINCRNIGAPAFSNLIIFSFQRRPFPSPEIVSQPSMWNYRYCQRLLTVQIFALISEGEIYVLK